jgi:NAD+ diphosphatase
MNAKFENLFYATSYLDRRSEFRLETNKVHALQKVEESVFLPQHQLRSLFYQHDDGAMARFWSYEQAAPFMEDGLVIYLGHEASEGRHYFALDVSAYDENHAGNVSGDDDFWEDLRRAGPLSQRTLASHLAYARGLFYWHQRHRFCGSCGSPTHVAQAGHMRQCSNGACGELQFPRTDPAVIMLIHDGERCLLAHHARLKEGMYSTLAGFVEPGETLEQAVRREVMEEAGIEVGEVTYAGSQPWPFPSSLMLGFYGRAQSEKITIAEDELTDAQWFSRKDLNGFKEAGRFLPSADSIARNLIEYWLKAE